MTQIKETIVSKLALLLEEALREILQFFDELIRRSSHQKSEKSPTLLPNDDPFLSAIGTLSGSPISAEDIEKELSNYPSRYGLD